MVRWNALLWAIFLVAISIACWQLFPGPLFWVDGGLRGILLVCAVDFVLGPLLAFLVADPSKTLLARRIDLMVLFSVQIGAMIWGSWQIYTQHPVAISYMREGFALPVIARDFAEQNITSADIPHSLLGKIPAYFVDLPTGKGAGMAIYQATKRHVPLTAQPQLLKPLFSSSEVFTTAGKFQSYWAGPGASDWQAWSAQHGNKAVTDYRFILLGGRYGNAALVLDQDNTLLGHIALPDGDPSRILPAK